MPLGSQPAQHALMRLQAGTAPSAPSRPASCSCCCSSSVLTWHAASGLNHLEDMAFSSNPCTPLLAKPVSADVQQCHAAQGSLPARQQCSRSVPLFRRSAHLLAHDKLQRLHKAVLAKRYDGYQLVAVPQCVEHQRRQQVGATAQV